MKSLSINISLYKNIFLFIILIFFIVYKLEAKNGAFQNIQILKEDKTSFTIKEILNNDSQFVKYIPSSLTRIKKSYWIKFSYKKPDKQKSCYLKFPFILYQQLDLYFINDETLYHYKSGLNLGFSQRNVHSPNIYLKLPNNENLTTCYVHVVGYYNYSFFIDETETDSMFQQEFKNTSTVYFFIGISCLSIVIGLIFFIVLKEKLYLYYALFSLMLTFSRLNFSGFIYNYIGDIYIANSLKSIFNLYSLSYVGINIALLLYFHEYLKFETRSKLYYKIIYSIIILRIVFLILVLFTENNYLIDTFNSYFIDLFIQLFIFGIIIKTYKKYFLPTLMAFMSLLIFLSGNLIFIVNDLEFFEGIDYSLFLDLAGIEVVIFAISIAYRNLYLKRKHDSAVALVIQNMKESEILKDNINKELEIKVIERTVQINEMNQLLKLHNIQLKTEVNQATEALIFQKEVDFTEFKIRFPDDSACLSYLSKLKWEKIEIIKCKKCGNDKFATTENFSIRCKKCRYVESVINGTLFHGLKFSILKAFYITYFATTSKQNSTTVEALSNELDLRPATLWTFKQKVLALMEGNKSKKKHKDGWTHLMEYSIK